MASAEDDMHIPMWLARKEQIMGHAAEGRYARACADQENVPVQWVREFEMSLRSAQTEYRTFPDLVEEIGGACAFLLEGDHQFETVGAIGP